MLRKLKQNQKILEVLRILYCLLILLIILCVCLSVWELPSFMYFIPLCPQYLMSMCCFSPSILSTTMETSLWLYCVFILLNTSC